jgi:hypothetical protein
MVLLSNAVGEIKSPLCGVELAHDSQLPSGTVDDAFAALLACNYSLHRYRAGSMPMILLRACLFCHFIVFAKTSYKPPPPYLNKLHTNRSSDADTIE